MADEIPSLQIDTDWKKQAQEEKRRLAEQQKQREEQAAASAPAIPPTMSSAAAAATTSREGAARGGREMPPASFATLVQSTVTQALYYLGDLAVRGGEPVINLDLAKHHIDTLAVLEEKTANNLTEDEKRMLDSSIYETRMRFVNVASQFIS